MGQRSCISSEHLLNFLLYSTDHGRAAASSLSWVFLSLLLLPYSLILLFSVWVLPLPSFWFLSSEKCPFVSPTCPPLQSAFHLTGILLGQAESTRCGFHNGGKPVMFVFSGIWEIERKKGTRKATAFGIHIVPLLPPVMKRQLFWLSIIQWET